MGEITLLVPANTHSHYCRQSWAFSRERCSFGSLLSYTSEGQRSDQVINTESDPFSSLCPLPPAHLQNKGQLDPGPGCPSTTAPHAQGIAFPVLLPLVRRASYTHRWGARRSASTSGQIPEANWALAAY